MGNVESKATFIFDLLTSKSGRENIEEAKEKLEEFLNETDYRASFRTATMCIINCYGKGNSEKVEMPNFEIINEITTLLKERFVSKEARTFMAIYLDAEKVESKKSYTKVIIMSQKHNIWEFAEEGSLLMLA